MEKISLGKNVFIYPMPVVLVGTLKDKRPNFMTVGWVSRVNAEPPMLAIGVYNVHYTNECLKQKGVFSVCFPGASLVSKTDHCGMVSGRNEDKSVLFDLFYGETGAPMIRECPLNLECRLVHTVTLPTNNLYIGEIVASFADPSCMTDGLFDIRKADPMLLTMPDNRFWHIGEPAGKAWCEGKRLVR